MLAHLNGEFDVVASCQLLDSGTEWHVVAVAGQTLVTVDATSPKPDWVGDNPMLGHARDDERVSARLVRIDDIASIELVETTVAETIGELVFSGQRQLIMRDDTQVAVSASRNHPEARQACDAVAHHLADAMRHGSAAELDTSTAATGS